MKTGNLRRFLLRTYTQGVVMVATPLVVIDLIFPPHRIEWKADMWRVLIFMAALPFVMAAGYWYGHFKGRKTHHKSSM